MFENFNESQHVIHHNHLANDVTIDHRPPSLLAACRPFLPPAAVEVPADRSRDKPVLRRNDHVQELVTP